MSSGKAGGAGTTYDYFGTIACGVCIGPVDDIVSIILDGNEVWPTNVNAWPSGTAGFNVTSGQLWVYDAQVWVAQQSFAVPADVQNTDPTIPGNDAAYWVQYTFPRPGSFSPAGADYSDFTITAGQGTSEPTTYGTLRFYWGESPQTVDNVLNGHNDTGDVHPGYSGISYCVCGPGTTNDGNSGGFLLGQEVQAAPNIEIVIRRAPVQTVVTDALAGAGAADIVDGQCNLAAFMAEILTSENGIGLGSAQLDATSWNAVAAYLQGNQLLFGASPLVDTSETLREVCDKFTQMIDGYIRFNPNTGLIELGVYEHGVTPAANTNAAGTAPNGYITLTEDSLTERPQLKSTSWQGTYSRATVRYNDRQLDYQQTSLHADDPRAWAVLKSVREISLDRPWITRGAQALLHGRETLRVVGHAQMTGTLNVRREIGRWIRGGDYVLLDVDIEPNQQTIYQFFRVTKRQIPPTGPVKLEVFADNSLAPIVANNIGAPALPSGASVPPVSSFRLTEIPSVLSDLSGAVTALVQRPSNLVTSCALDFDTSTGGTFPTLGTFSGFAAKAVLAANVAATDASISVNVDSTQPDAFFFTNQYTANQQADDTMLALIFQTVSDPGQPDDGQIAEDANGYAEMEICSVGAPTLTGAAGTTFTYSIPLLRARQNTIARAFTSAQSEVWLIPRANVAAFTSAAFATLRANRAAGVNPSYGQFRFCPATFTSQYPLSSAANEPFRFPLKSLAAPTLALTAPGAWTLNEAPASFPLVINVAGTWTDPGNALCEVKVLLRASTDTADRSVSDVTFAPCGSFTFNTNVQIDSAGGGSWLIKLIARDASNLTTERDITVNVSTTPAAKCAMPDVFDALGAQILNAGGAAPSGPEAYGSGPTGPLGSSGDAWTSNPNRFIPYGALALNCSTPGATIYFETSGPVQTPTGLQIGAAHSGQGDPYSAALLPFHGLVAPVKGGSDGDTVAVSYTLTIWARAAGYNPSDALIITIPLIVEPS